MCLQYLFSVCVCDFLCARHMLGAYQMSIECVNDSDQNTGWKTGACTFVKVVEVGLYTLKRPFHVCCLLTVSK